MHLVNDPDTKGYGRASVNLTSIRETDNGWYECQLIFPNRTPTTRNNGTWFYLTVNGIFIQFDSIIFIFFVCF